MANSPRQKPRSTFGSLAALLAGGAVGYAYVRHRRSHSLKRRFLSPAAIALSPPPHPGDILLFHNARGTNNITDWLTGSPFYHVGLYAGIDRAIEARTRGVVYDSLSDRLHDFIVVPAPQGKGEAALAWARSKVGDPYDNVDIGVIVLEHVFTHLHLNYTPGDRFTCAEFVARAFDQAGIRLFPDIDTTDVVPADFARLLPQSAIPPH